MKLIYGTTNKAKIAFMRERTELLGIEILGLGDVCAPALYIAESGNNPLENARIKALAYYEELKRPVFSCDTGLYIEGLDKSRQPGANVRGAGDHMSDDDAIAHYCALAMELGGRMTARYQNAICLVLGDGTILEHMGEDLASEPFHIVAKPHGKRTEGFPLDSLSVHIDSGKYYYDLGNQDKSAAGDDGFTAFFRQVTDHIGGTQR